MNLPVTNVPRFISRNAKTTGFQHLQLPDMTASSGPPDGASIAHYRTDELLIKQHTVSNEQASSSIRRVPARSIFEPPFNLPG
jgi:hypothetical protein